MSFCEALERFYELENITYISMAKEKGTLKFLDVLAV